MDIHVTNYTQHLSKDMAQLVLQMINWSYLHTYTGAMYVCNMCGEPSAVKCVSCDSGAHATCRDTIVDEWECASLCGLCRQRCNTTVAQNCHACNDTHREQHVVQCTRCDNAFHPACIDVSSVMVCRRHGINACICSEQSAQTLCETCVLDQDGR